MSPSRRRLLQLGCSALSLALAGCSGERERRETTGASRTAPPTTAPPEPTTSTPTTNEPTSSAPATDESTADEPATPLPPTEQRYPFGGWHVDEPWKLTVAEMELSTTFRTDDGETYEMPDGEQLLVVTARVENVGTRRHGYTGALDGLIDGRVYEDDYSFEHPDYEHGIGLDELAQVEHVARYRPHAHQVEPGDIVSSWLAWTVPRDVTQETVRIGYDPDNDGSYPIRWLPA